MDNFSKHEASTMEQAGSRSTSRLRSQAPSSTGRSQRNLTPDPTSYIANNDPRFNELNKSSRILRSVSNNNLSTVIQGQTLLPIFENYLEPLQRIFQYYCSFGDPLNTKGMKSLRFKKLLRECGLLQVQLPRYPLCLPKTQRQQTHRTKTSLPGSSTTRN